MPTILNKGSLEELDYQIDWTRQLGAGESVTASTWIVPAPLTQPQAASIGIDSRSTKIWLAGGEEGARYEIYNRVTTNQGRIIEAIFQLEVVKQFA